MSQSSHRPVMSQQISSTYSMNPTSDTDDSQSTLLTGSGITKFFRWAPMTYRKLAVAALFINLHFGIPALVFSLLAQMDYENGDVKGARRKAGLVFKLAVAGICMTVFFVVHMILLHVFVFPYTIYPNLFPAHYNPR